MSHPMSSDRREEEKEALKPEAGPSSRKYMKMSEGLPGAVSASSLTDMTEHPINVTGVTGGTIGTSNVAGLVEGGMGNTANIIFNGPQNIVTPPSACDSLSEWTISKLDIWTKGIVETAALKKVMDKINKGVSWVTIKGCPGEGKTTTAHMALKKLNKAGRKIFKVTTPEEFSTVVTSCRENPAIMLDDVFGNLEFDKTEWSKWKPTLLKTLEDHTYNSVDDRESVDKQCVTIILVGRQYVLNVCVSDLGKVADFLTHENHVVNMSNPEQRDFEEKVEIWKAISASSLVKLDDDTIQKICQISVPHGFPHVCKLFVTLCKKIPDLSADLFFEKPLEFLNETISKFIQNKEKCNLFKAMLENGGKITARKIEDHEDENMSYVVKDLVGSYLKKEDNCFTFDHPSIYDSVAYNLCDIATSFVIQNCEMNFIHERIRLQKDNDPESDTHLVKIIHRDFIKELAERFAKELSEGNFSRSLCHQAFTDAEFIEETMSSITVDFQKLVQMQDMTVRQSFWTLLSSNGSPELLKYVKEHHVISREEKEWIFHGVCHFAATEVLCYMEQSKLLDINSCMSQSRDGENAAMMAAKGRNPSFVDKIISLNPDVHFRDAIGHTLIHLLAENGLEEAVERVIKNGADVNCKNQWRSTPLMYACKGGHENIVQMLLEKEAYVNVVDHRGSTALLYACTGSNATIVQMLIEKGASFDERDSSGNTPLFYACWENHENTVQILLKAGARIYGDVLSVACNTGNVKLVESLLQKDPDIVVSDYTYTVPMIAAVKSRNVKMVEFLINCGMSVNNGNPLISACIAGLSEIVKVLIKGGADVNAKDYLSGEAPLHVASSAECFNLLLRFKPNLNARTKLGDSVTHIAAKNGFTEGIRALIKEKIDIDIKNINMETPLVYALQGGWCDCVKLLIDAGADVNHRFSNGNTPVLIAKNPESFRLLIRAGADVNALNNQNISLLYHILYLMPSPDEILPIIIKEQANVNVRDDNENTPLHVATKLHKWPCIPLLLQAGANPKLTNLQGQTPLHLAFIYSNNETPVDVIDHFIKHRANVNSQDCDGNTPLHLVSQGSVRTDRIIDLLIRTGADVNIKNKYDVPAQKQG